MSTNMKRIRFSDRELEVIIQAMVMSGGEFDGELDHLGEEEDVYKLYESAMHKMAQMKKRKNKHNRKPLL